MRLNLQSRVLFIPLTALGLVLASCGGGNGSATTSTGPATTVAPTTTATTNQSPTTTAPTTTSTVESTTTTNAAMSGYVVYLLLDDVESASGPYLVPVYRESNDPGPEPLVAVSLLMEGPTSGESTGTPAISTAIPSETTVIGVDVQAGVATVDLTSEFDDGGGSFGMFARLAQVVFTLTRSPDIDSVSFSLAGEPVTVFSSEGIELNGPQERSDYYDFLPAIFVDSPAWGEPVTSPLAASGLSNVFEAVSQVLLTDDDGATLFEDKVMATCGTGCWGEWNIDVTYNIDRNQFGSLIVWEYSAKDGSRVNIREYPVQLR